MNLNSQIARHIRDVHFGGNWTVSNLRDTLSDVTWQEAVVKIDAFNTITALVYHINYFISAVAGVLQGEPLMAKDMYSFDHPPVENENDWRQMLDKTWSDAETLAALIETLPRQILEEDFVDGKYGSYFRNLHGIIEHTHYHLGQIVILKKIIRSGKA